MTGTQNAAPTITAKQVEVANTLRTNSVGWIGSADSKATTIASVLAVVLGLVSMDMAQASHAASLEVVYRLFLGLGALSVVLCVATLWPVTNRRRLLPTSALVVSPTYFGDVPRDFETFLTRTTTDDELRRDALEQAFVVARIARRKMLFVRATIASFVLTMLTLVSLAFLASFRQPAAPPTPDPSPPATIMPVSPTPPLVESDAGAPVLDGSTTLPATPAR